MGKKIAASLLLCVSLAAATTLHAQTRPRLVGQRAGVAVESESESESTARAVEQPATDSGRARTVSGGPRYEGERRGSRWPRLLLGAGIAIGAGRIGGRSCTPSRGVFGRLPRLF